MEITNFIDGELQAAQTGKWLSVINPAINEEIAQLNQSDAHAVSQAIAAAKQAFPSWASLKVEERLAYLERLAQSLEAHTEKLALAETDNTGKPLWLASSLDIPRCATNFRFFIRAMSQVAESCYPMDDVALNYTLHQPLGVVACISPWNLPLYLLTWKIAPALAAGNTVVAKPSEVTPVTAYLFSQMIQEAGIPPGVINIVHGTGDAVGDALCQHPDVRAVSFTGSTQTGRHIAKAVADSFKKLSLEMGGKNPAIVCADCDFDKAVNGVLRSAFTNQGEVCVCTSRILVESSIHDKFVEALVKGAKQYRVGDPLESTTQVGAMVSPSHYQKVMRYVKLAREEGGEFLCGGAAATVPGRCERGLFIQPSVMVGLSPHCQTNRDEIFGPLVSVQAFQGDDEAIAIANDTQYGLAATVWTENISRAHRLSAQLESGLVWVNTWMTRDLRIPFGGAKQSGLGREGGMEALRFFSETKNVCIYVKD